MYIGLTLFKMLNKLSNVKAFLGRSNKKDQYDAVL
jgi:hypothetical protein